MVIYIKRSVLLFKETYGVLVAVAAFSQSCLASNFPI